MARVIRRKANFLPLVNGVKFTKESDGVSISEVIKKEAAEQFLELEGYELEEEPEAPKKGATKAKAGSKSETESKAGAESSQPQEPPQEPPQGGEGGAGDESF